MTNDTAHSYTYDAEGHVISIDGGATLKESYNALGWRVEAINCCGVVDYLHDAAGNMVGGAANAGAGRSEQYVYFRGGLLAQYWNGQGLWFAHLNALGSTQQFTNYAGLNPNESLFYPFGQLGPQGGGAYFEGLWAGFEDGNFWSTTTGEWQTDTRRYTPGSGRWYTPDPIGKAAARLDDPQTWNMYAYARNNPTTLTDPSGLLYCGPANGGVPSCISDTEYARTPKNYGDYTHFSSSLDDVRTVEVVLTGYASPPPNDLGHVAVSVGGEPPLGYEPVDQEPIAPGAVEPVDLSRDILDQATIEVTPEQADRIQTYIVDTAANPGEYNYLTNNCAKFVAGALQAGNVPVVQHFIMTPEEIIGETRGVPPPLPFDVTAPE